MRRTVLNIALSAAFVANACTALAQTPPSHPWMNRALSADSRAQMLLNAMTQDEKLTLVFGYFSADAPWKKFTKPEGGRTQSAGYVPGIPRLDIPAQWETDAGIGVASQPGDNATPATALPANLAIAASWDPELGFKGGQMIGNEARLRGFNVLLAGGINLNRDPRNGRNFEYPGDDPLLAATMVGAQISGAQSNHIISTIKHYAINDQETNRNHLNAIIDEQSARQSDLLAFELAFEQAKPGAVMCAYNRLNGVYACEHPWLLNDVLKTQWGFKGYVMSDWGGTHSTIPAANAGLDQQSGYPFDESPYFSGALKEAVTNGHVRQARLDDMTRRILWAMFNSGLFDNPVKPEPEKIDFKAHLAVSRAAAEGGMVLLKNARELLPLNSGLKSIAIIGSHADTGVLSGGGSSQVYSSNGVAFVDKEIKNGPQVYHKSSPLQGLASRLPAKLTYAPGTDIDEAKQLAKHSDAVIVFAHQWSAEGKDGDLHLDGKQDELISALAKENPNLVVVLENGGPVLMPWLNDVSAVLAAWYPGSDGGEAIARVLTGEVNPSGRLPLTFPQSLAQLPRPALPGYPEVPGTRIDVDYLIDGAAVGYKWFDLKGLQPLFPFGYGLSYTHFDYSGFKAQVTEQGVSAHFIVKNAGKRSGGDVAQVYVSGPASAKWEAPKRLGAFRKQFLAPGASATVDLKIEPRLLAVWNVARQRWVIAEGDYVISLAKDANTPVTSVTVHLAEQAL